MQYLPYSQRGRYCDARLTSLQALTLKRGEHIVEYLSRLIELVSKLEGAGYSVSEMDRKHTLLRGLPNEYDVIVEVIRALEHTYSHSVAKLMVSETRALENEGSRETALKAKMR